MNPPYPPIFLVQPLMRVLLSYDSDIERKMLRKDGKIGSHMWHFEGSSEPNTPGINGKNSYPKANVSLDAIRSMFEAYKTIPKFAYVNAMAAHIYDRYTTVSPLLSRAPFLFCKILNFAVIPFTYPVPGFKDDTCR